MDLKLQILFCFDFSLPLNETCIYVERHLILPVKEGDLPPMYSHLPRFPNAQPKLNAFIKESNELISVTNSGESMTTNENDYGSYVPDVTDFPHPPPPIYETHEEVQNNYHQSFVQPPMNHHPQMVPGPPPMQPFPMLPPPLNLQDAMNQPFECGECAASLTYPIPSPAFPGPPPMGVLSPGFIVASPIMAAPLTPTFVQPQMTPVYPRVLFSPMPMSPMNAGGSVFVFPPQTPN